MGGLKRSKDLLEEDRETPRDVTPTEKCGGGGRNDDRGWGEQCRGASHRIFK